MAILRMIKGSSEHKHDGLSGFRGLDKGFMNVSPIVDPFDYSLTV